jgi:hypothetical protein
VIDVLIDFLVDLLIAAAEIGHVQGAVAGCEKDHDPSVQQATGQGLPAQHP